jgi:HSP20 family protein
MLMRFDPFREMDRVTDQLLGRAAPAIPMDAVRKGHQVVVYFELPGVDQDSIDLTVERNVLTLRAERRWQPAEDEEVLASERRQGAFTRQLFLGETLDANGIDASYKDGVLTVIIPVAETAKPRRVNIGATGGNAQAIEAEHREG